MAYCVLPALLGISAALLLLLVASGPAGRAYAGTLTFPGACGGTIQACIDSASPGDTILISAGDYAESLTLSKAVSLTGALSSTTILHALPNTRVLTVTGAAVDNSVVISGLTFTGGLVTGTQSCPQSCGGGILITGTAQPRLENVILTNNTAGWKGGGLYAGGDIVLIGTQFLTNTVEGAGNVCCWGAGGASVNGAATLVGGLFQGNQCKGGCFDGGLGASRLVMTGTQFLNNSAGFIGGGASAVNATLQGGLFQGNVCTDPNCDGGGLNVFLALTATDTRFIGNVAGHCGGGACAGSATLVDAQLLGNTAGTGGGLGVHGTLALTNTLFLNNTAQLGAGLYHNGGTGRLVNNLFAANQAGSQGDALYLASPGSVVILHNTIASPTLGSGAAIVVISGTVGLTNTIVASYTTGISLTAGSAFENYTLFSGVAVAATGGVGHGGHSLVGNPALRDPAHADYHLTPGSAAINAGADAGVTTDFEGDSRPLGGFDIGYDEFVPFKLFLALVRR